MEEKKKTFKMPHVFIILMIIMLIVVAISYLVPSGEFEKTVGENGTQIVNPDNFQYVEQKDPIGFMDYFKSIYNGIVDGAVIIASLLICSGVLKFLEDTGTFSAAIHRMLSGAKGKELQMVVVFYTVFSLFGVLGYGEGAYPFFPITTAVIMALGFDRLAGAATIMISSAAGFSCGMLNLFTTGVSQQIVGLPLFSGIGYRAICFAVFYILGLVAVLWYCRKIKKDPQKSYVKEEYLKQLSGEIDPMENVGKSTDLNGKRVAALIGFVVLVIIQGIGCIKLGWGLGEVASLYIIFAIILAILFKVAPSKVCVSITQGASNVLGPCIAIGLARSVMLLMNQAQILDTIVHTMGNALQGKSPFLTLALILAFVTALNFFVVSGSGKAVMMMPILSPLGKMLGINQQVMVLTYQLGDGFTNYLWPAGALVGCALCKLDYGAWFRFAWKALGLQILASYLLIIIADMINLGPF